MSMFSASMAARILNAASGSEETLDLVNQQEAISYKIEYDDGKVEQGEL
jgi:hypothetical protein